MPTLSIVVPCYNEEKRIERTLGLLEAEFSNDFAEVLVADASKDRTPEIAEGFAKRWSAVRLLRCPQRGKGAQIVFGLKKCSAKTAMMFDADSASAPNECRKLLFALKDCDIAVGSRRNEKVKNPLLREVASRGYSGFVQLLFGLGIKDTQCGFKAFGPKAVEFIKKEDFQEKGFVWDVEMIWKAKKAGLKISEVQIAWKDEEGGTVSVFTAMKMFWETLKLRLSG